MDLFDNIIYVLAEYFSAGTWRLPTPTRQTASLMWRWQLSLCEAVNSQKGHLKGRSPVWVLICKYICLRPFPVLEHSGQANRLGAIRTGSITSPVCSRMWVLISCFVLVFLKPQRNGQLKCSGPIFIGSGGSNEDSSSIGTAICKKYFVEKKVFVFPFPRNIKNNQWIRLD